MKNTKTNVLKGSLLAIIAVAMITVIGFAFITCDDGNGNNNNNNGDGDGDGTAPTITTTTLPGGTVGTPYSQTLTATGDTPITWTLDSGTLPTSLTISTAGVISGTPTVANTFNFKVKATNGAGSVTKDLSIVIVPQGGLLDENTFRLYDVPVTYQDQTSATNFGFYYDSGIKPLSDVISGTPKVTIANSKLTIEFDAPKNAALEALTDFFPGIGEGITATPNASASVFEIGNFYESTGSYGLAIFGPSRAFLVYTDQNVTLNGTYNDGSITFSCSNLTLQQGWNYVIDSYDSDTFTATYSATRTLPNGYNWTVYNDED